jgi:hypothetical protein
VLAAEGVSEESLRTWLAASGLALIVTRDQTSRDRAELQRPFKLRMPGGVKTVSRDRPGGRTYDIAHFQLFEGDQVRACPGRPGRRVPAQPLHDAGRTRPDLANHRSAGQGRRTRAELDQLPVGRNAGMRVLPRGEPAGPGRAFSTPESAGSAAGMAHMVKSLPK